MFRLKTLLGAGVLYLHPPEGGTPDRKETCAGSSPGFRVHAGPEVEALYLEPPLKRKPQTVGDAVRSSPGIRVHAGPKALELFT